MNALKLFGAEYKEKHSYVQRLLFFVAILGPLFFLSIPTPAYAGSIINRTLFTGLTNSLVGHWTFDSPDLAGTTAYDRSSSGRNGTLTNGPVSTIGRIGQALSFSTAQANYVTASGVTELDSASTFTMSFWGKRGASNSIISVYRGSNTSCNHVNITPYSDGLVYFRICAGADAYGTYSLNDTKWHHYTMVYDGSLSGNSRLQAYVDGVNISSSLSFTGTIPATSGSYTGGLDIGRHNLTDANDGVIDDVRIYNRALSADEIKRLYKMGGTFKINDSRKDTLTNGLVGYWTFDGLDMAGVTAYDRSGQGNKGTLTLSPTRTLGKIGQALLFDGADDYVTVNSATSINDISPMTISAWIYPKSLGQNGFGRILDKSLTTSPTFGWDFQLTTTNVLHFVVDYDGANDLVRESGANAVTLNTWQHIVVTWDGSSAQTGVHLYINGIETSYTNNTDGAGNRVTDAGNNLVIGNNATNFNRTFDGNIDDVRVYNRVLSAQEITRLYKMGGTFYINTTRKDSLTNGLLAYWTFDANDVSGADPFYVYDKSGNGYIASSTGTGIPTKAIGRMGQGLQFNGTSNFLGTMNINFNSSSAVSVAFWQATTTQGAAATALEVSTNYNNVTDGLNIGFHTTAPGCADFIGAMYDGTVYSSNCPPLYTANSGTPWHHYVVILDKSKTSSEVSVYMDAVSQTNNGGSDNNQTNTFGIEPLFMGARYNTNSPSQFFTGVLDDVRVYNRVLTTDEIKRLYAMGK